MHAELPRARLVSRTHRVQATDPITFFAGGSHSKRALWLRPSSGEALVGLGSARTLTGRGPSRFADLAREWRTLMADAAVEGGQPVALGGFRFDPLAEHTPAWAAFADADLTLPERMLTLRADAAWLTTNCVSDPSAPSRVRAPAQSSARRELAPTEWRRLVGEVAAGIRDGTLGVRKVVLARSQSVACCRTVDAALRWLAAEYPTCAVFAFAEGETCFLGATPERLVSVRAGVATSMALAGSAPRGATAEEDRYLAQRLMADPKECTEHAVVVNALQNALAPFCETLLVDAEPRVAALPNVQHLLTSVRGHLSREHTVLGLAAALHPTPAVGGFPRQPALEVIREREQLDRGWYAGPIGWLNAAGEGEFVVALRSALVERGRAMLFAGCGILGDSQPEREYAEWGWKLRPMLAALGTPA
jgi:isochorismate synthase